MTTRPEPNLKAKLIPPVLALSAAELYHIYIRPGAALFFLYIVINDSAPAVMMVVIIFYFFFRRLFCSLVLLL
jgi:hypothetical protein